MLLSKATSFILLAMAGCTSAFSVGGTFLSATEKAALEETAAAVATPGKELIGNKGKNTLTGTTGDDTIDGRGGSDTLLGEDGNDTILGSWGWDTIRGGAGDDTINGGPGQDTLSGGTGRDVFVFEEDKSSSTDVITDFESGIDRLDVGKLVSLGALDANSDGLVDHKFLTNQGNGLLLDLSTAGGGKVSLNNVDTLSINDFV